MFLAFLSQMTGLGDVIRECFYHATYPFFFEGGGSSSWMSWYHCTKKAPGSIQPLQMGTGEVWKINATRRDPDHIILD